MQLNSTLFTMCHADYLFYALYQIKHQNSADILA